MTRWVTTAGWEDTPHLSAATKKAFADSYPPHERDARTKGIPQLGSGAIYPVPESEITVAPVVIPEHWKMTYALDVGWNRTACIWAALDTDADVAYLWAEYYRSVAEPAIHAQAIRARGEWIPGVVDPASRGRTQHDGQQLLTMYRDLGLNLTLADNAVEAGIFDVWTRLSTGRLRVFSTLANWFAEYRMYRRDEKGRLVKENDHLMDATRYLVRSGLTLASFRPLDQWQLGKKNGRNAVDHDPFAEMNR